MLNSKRFLAVIPARGGSKSVPRKNIRPLGGRPLLTYTVDQVKEVPEIDLCVVSTDDAEISAIAIAAGARALTRPAEISGDTAPTEWALLHALDVLEEKGERFDYVMVLEPTSPFRRPETIRACMERIVADKGQSLMTVIETRSNIGHLKDGVFAPLVPGAPRRRQERQPFYVESSTVYVARTDFLRDTGTLVCDHWLAVVVDDSEAVDINSELDFERAESIIARRQDISPQE